MKNKISFEEEDGLPEVKNYAEMPEVKSPRREDGMNRPIIPLFKVFMSPEVDEPLLEVLHSGWIGEGPKVAEFEEEIANRINNSLCLALSSGTHGLTLALRLIDIKRHGKGKGSVVTTPMTCFATIAPIIDNGAEIIWADIQEDMNIDPDSVREKIREDTKAILFVHWGGYSADLKELYKISQEFNIPLIEDAAHSFGSYYRDRPIGDCSFSDYGIFSFQAIKNLTCFPSGTRIVKGLVKTEKGGGLGTVPIENLKIGDVVRTYNEKKGKKENKKITQIFKRNYDGNLIKIKLKNGNELRMTEEHPVYIIKKGWRGYIPANKLSIGDEIFQYEYQGLFFRLYGINQRGKKVEELFGKKKGKEIRRIHSELTKGEAHFNYGKSLSKEWKDKIGKGNLGKHYSINQKKRMSISQIKKWEKIKKDPIKYQKFCDKMKKVGGLSEIRAKKSKKSRDFYLIKENREKQKEKVLKAMETNEYWDKYLKNMPLKKSNLEIKLENILNELIPGEYGFNGDGSLGIVLARMIPDFVNINGKKKVIELFGNYWHKRRAAEKGLSVKLHIEERKKRYKKIGWDCLIVQENELENLSVLEKKIQNFSVNPKSKIVSIVGIQKEKYSGPVYNIETKDNHNYFAFGILVHNCIDGGMLFLKNTDDYSKAKLLRWFGIDRTGEMRDLRCREDIEIAGYKFHMNDVCATIGLCNLKHFDANIEQARSNAAYYDAHLKFIPGIKLIQAREDRYSSYWLFTILVEDRTGFARKMGECGIAVSQVHARTDFHSCVSQYESGLPSLDHISQRHISIPVGAWVAKEDREYIVYIISKGW